MISARYSCCRVRCPQRINLAAAKESPLRTADATAACHVERSETSLAIAFGLLRENHRFFSRDCGIRMIIL
jgi:hypothetical protein